MPFTGYLSAAEIGQLTKAAVDSGLLAQPRALMLRGIRPSFAATLQGDSVPLTQFRLDLTRLTNVERLIDGSVPLVVYLGNAAELINDLPQSEVFRKLENLVRHRATGSVKLIQAAQLPQSIITKEAIIHQDDTVDRTFIDGCLTAAQCVAKIVVPRFDAGAQKFINGGPWIFRGTGWLITNDLVVTNHHVINSRPDDEGLASDVDFRLQAEKSEVIFDFDTENAVGQHFTNSQLVAADAGLDFCILRLSSSPARGYLPLERKSVVVTPTTYLPLNVIQHPDGKPKRFALRNNLAVNADNDIVRYYTDTDRGASGSPVLDDHWRVRALHRGAVFEKAMFNGKETTYVNVGSQIVRVLEELQHLNPNAYAEIP